MIPKEYDNYSFKKLIYEVLGSMEQPFEYELDSDMIISYISNKFKISETDVLKHVFDVILGDNID